jgi:hypothetical protein
MLHRSLLCAVLQKRTGMLKWRSLQHTFLCSVLPHTFLCSALSSAAEHACKIYFSNRG